MIHTFFGFIIDKIPYLSKLRKRSADSVISKKLKQNHQNFVFKLLLLYAGLLWQRIDANENYLSCNSKNFWELKVNIANRNINIFIEEKIPWFTRYSILFMTSIPCCYQNNEKRSQWFSEKRKNSLTIARSGFLYLKRMSLYADHFSLLWVAGVKSLNLALVQR